MSILPLCADDGRRPPWLERRNAGVAALRHGLPPDALEQLDALLAAPRRLEKNRVLYRAGNAAPTLFVIQSGTFKSVSYLPGGRTQITGVHIVGDILGLPGIAEGTHPEDAIALEYSQVAPLPLAEFQRVARLAPGLHRNLARILGAAVARTKRALLLLGHRNADERLASFFLDVSGRLRLAGYSGAEFQLPLTNNDLANLAGMTGETVSRLLRTMQAQRLIERHGRRIRLTDMAALERLAGVAAA